VVFVDDRDIGQLHSIGRIKLLLLGLFLLSPAAAISSPGARWRLRAAPSATATWSRSAAAALPIGQECKCKQKEDG
jgi:hypothetical protein